MQCFSLVLDKVDLIQALEFGDDLKNLSFQPSYRCIMTSTDAREDKDKNKDE